VSSLYCEKEIREALSNSKEKKKKKPGFVQSKKYINEQLKTKYSNL